MPTKPAADYVLNTGHADAVNRLVAYPLLDGSGPARDLAGLLADITLGADASWVSTAEGPAISFDGSGSGLVSATNAALNLTGDFTLEIAWIHKRDDIQQQGLLDFLDGGSPHAKCPIFIDGNLIYARSGGGENVSTTSVSNDARFHVVSRWNGTTLSLWVNNSNEDNATPSGPTDTGADTALNMGESFYDGRCQLLLVNAWSRALSDADLSARFTDPYRDLQSSGEADVPLLYRRPLGLRGERQMQQLIVQ